MCVYVYVCVDTGTIDFHGDLNSTNANVSIVENFWYLQQYVLAVTVRQGKTAPVSFSLVCVSNLPVSLCLCSLCLSLCPCLCLFLCLAVSVLVSVSIAVFSQYLNH